MRRYKRSPWVGIFLCLSILLSACGTGAVPTPAGTVAGSQSTQPPAKTQAPASTVVPSPQLPQSGKLDLVSTSGYKDSSGDFHVVGLIHNGMSQAVDNIELTLVMKDASGKSLLRDQNNQPLPSVKFNPILDTLAPGEASPFDYFVNTADVGEPAPNGFAVTITGQETTTVTRATLTIKNLQMISDGSGSFYITGEILNTESKPVQISSFGAAALDSNNAVVAATDTGDLVRTLAPSGDSAGNDRTPFSFQLEAPSDNAKQ